MLKSGELKSRVERFGADWALILLHRAAIRPALLCSIFIATLVKAFAECTILAEYRLARGAGYWSDGDVLEMFCLDLAFRAIALQRRIIFAVFKVIAVIVTMVLFTFSRSMLAICLTIFLRIALRAASASFFLALDSCAEPRAPA